MQHVAVFLIGVAVGLVSGLFGKGGSAMATPLLQLIGIPAFVAVAAPLPAAIPATLAASIAYFKAHLYNKRVLLWSIGSGFPATVLGAWLSSYVGGKPLLIISDAAIVALGFALLRGAQQDFHRATGAEPPASSIAVVGAAVGFVSGLLANSGGVLLAPLYIRVLKLPVHMAFACSLLASAALAIPGTIVHAWLGHIDWAVVAVFAAGSIPFAYAGAKVALRVHPAKLEKLLGALLVVVGLAGLAEVTLHR